MVHAGDRTHVLDVCHDLRQRCDGRWRPPRPAQSSVRRTPDRPSDATASSLRLASACQRATAGEDERGQERHHAHAVVLRQCRQDVVGHVAWVVAHRTGGGGRRSQARRSPARAS
jgi:hypothetical protein